MAFSFDRPCEICCNTHWQTILENRKESVCSGRELIPSDLALVKVMCAQCGFVYTAQSPLDADLDGYYRATYSSKLRSADYDYINFAKGKTFGSAVNDFVLAHAFKPRGRLLDIGCGKGFFERAFCERYPNWRVEGVDPSERSIEIAREIAPTATFHLRNFRAADFETGAYDAISMHTVLNRVSPREFLGGARRLIREDGVLSMAIAIFPEAPFELYFADHTCLYFPQHVHAIAEEFGFECVARDEIGSIWRYIFRVAPLAGVSRRHALHADAARIRGGVRNIVQSWEDLFASLIQCRQEGRRVAFYGAGTSTMIALSQTQFPRNLLVGVFDDNPHKVGEECNEITIEPPGEKLRSADVVVLCAGPAGVEVMKRKLSAGVPTITLGASRLTPAATA